MGDIGRADELRQLGQERGARNLVVVEVEDPVAGRERVQPADRPVDGLAVGVADDAVGDRRERVLGLRVRAVVQRDDDLVGDRADQAEQRADAGARPAVMQVTLSVGRESRRSASGEEELMVVVTGLS